MNSNENRVNKETPNKAMKFECKILGLWNSNKQSRRKDTLSIKILVWGLHNKQTKTHKIEKVCVFFVCECMIVFSKSCFVFLFLFLFLFFDLRVVLSL